MHSFPKILLFLDYFRNPFVQTNQPKAMATRPAEVQQIDLTKLSLQQLQQLKNEFETVSNLVYD